MSVHRFQVVDHMNPWFLAIEVDADDPDQARRRAESMMFARRGVSEAGGVTIHPEETP